MYQKQAKALTCFRIKFCLKIIMAIIDYGSLTYKRNKSQFKNISKVTLSFSCNIFLQQMPILVRIKSTFLLVPPILVSPTQRRLVKQCTALSLTLQHHTPLLVAYFQLIQPRKSHHNPTLMFGHRLEGGLETNELQQHSLIEHFRVDTQSG